MDFNKPVTASQVQSVGAIDAELPSPLAVPYDSGVEDYPDGGPFSRVSVYFLIHFISLLFNCYTLYFRTCLLYTSPSPRDKRQSRMPSSA